MTEYRNTWLVIGLGLSSDYISHTLLQLNDQNSNVLKEFLKTYKINKLTQWK